MKTVRVLAAALLALAPLAAALWPRPEAFTVGRHTFCLARDVEWKAEQGFRSDILEAGFERYQRIIAAIPVGVGYEPLAPPGAASAASADGEAALLARLHPADGDADAADASGSTNGAQLGGRRCRKITTIEVSVTSSDQSLNLETRESYTLEVDDPVIMIQANSVYGALRAMESLSQLLRRRALQPGSTLEAAVPAAAAWPAPGGEEGEEAGPEEERQLGVEKRRKKKDKTVLLVDEISIYDAPRFRYRGLLIDTARHFLPVSVIKAHLDAMAMVKMNCLHWHLTDDQSFPWASDELPALAAEGAFAPEAVYGPDDIKEIVEYARFRGIRVIPELDTPGHTQSWGKSYPELLTRCHSRGGSGTGGSGSGDEPADQLGPINPARNETYGFLWRLLREAARIFPDPYIHLGGDEVDHACWESNPEVRQFMEEQGFGRDYGRLEGYHMDQMIRLASAAGKAPIVWQEAFDRGVDLPAGTRVQVWKWWRDEAQAARQQRIAADAAGAAGSSDPPAGTLAAGWGDGAAGGTAAERRLQMEGRPAQEQGREQQRQQGSQGMACTCTDRSARAEGDAAWKAELQAVTSQGYDTILSAPWYLNLGCYASEDWRAYYAVDPHGFEGTTEQKDRVLGGAACAWGEFIDAVNSMNRVWPRAAAVAERLWSPADATDADEAARRLADLRQAPDTPFAWRLQAAEAKCRMLSRGIAAQSMGPGFCPGELTTRM